MSAARSSLLLLLLALPVPLAFAPAPRFRAGDRIEAEGLHNVLALTNQLLSGSVPEGAAGFRSLRRLGVRTVLSVDGARPEVELAHRFGLRYAHIPIGYDGIRQEQADRLARAVQVLPGPIYLHCHHGKHRGPAAAAVIRYCLDATCGADDAVAFMNRAGTDPRYAGLYAAPARLHRPTPETLERIEADFPEVAPVGPLAEVMVHIDQRWDHLRAIEAAGWQAPPRHPDLVPASEALQLAELYTETARQPGIARYGPDFRQQLLAAARDAVALEGGLRAGEAAPVLSARARRVGAACTRCHVRYRDNPD